MNRWIFCECNCRFCTNRGAHPIISCKHDCLQDNCFTMEEKLIKNED